MHSIPLDEDPLPPLPGDEPFDGVPQARPADVELLDDLRGHVLAGRYALVELLGSGELGCVYSGRDQAGGQQVTVKVLASTEQREVIARVAERARRRLGVRHPCVAAVLSEGTMGGLWYAVMEHAPGKNLYHADGDPRFEGARLLALAAELAEGLATLHALGAPHGAISPHNLVWSDAGVKLVDLDVHLTGETANEEPSPWADVTALARVILELAAVREDEAPWVGAVARVARGELRPTAAEWVQQLRAAEIEALKPQIVAAAAQGEGAIDSAWDSLFDNAGVIATPGRPVQPLDTGLQRIEPPAQLAMVSFEVEPSLPEPAAARPEPARTRRAEPTPAQPVPAAAPAATAAPAPAVTPAPASPPRERPPTGELPQSRAPDAARATSTPTVLTASTTVPSTTGQRVDETWTRAQATSSRAYTQLGLGLLAFAVLCAFLAWLWARAQPAPAASEAPAPEPSAPASPGATASRLRSDLSSETATLARAAAPEPVVAALPVGEGDGIDEADASADPDGSSDQLSAADFRRILLRTNRTQRVRGCYERHGGAGVDDVEVVALVGRSGRVQKLRMGDDPLAECLRKVVLRLEFPRAERQAQHNYVFHRPPEGE